MAEKTILHVAASKSESVARMRSLFSVSIEQESEWMIRYTKIYTSELVFAVDLMSFVMGQNLQVYENFIYPNCLGRPCPSDFDDSMKKFISLTLIKFKVYASNMLEKNLNLDRPSFSEFKAYAHASALKVELSGYHAYAFLVFCVVMAQVSTVAYMHGILKAPDFGIMIMCRTYSNFREKGVLPQDAWNEIKIVVRDTTRLLELEIQEFAKTI